MEKKPEEREVTTIGELMKFLVKYDAETVDKLAKLLGAGAGIAKWESQNERENQRETKTESKNEKGVLFGGFTIKGL
jgi:hypothetical protein